MTSVLDQLTALPTWLVYLTVATLVFAEDALFIGFVLPGETAAIIGGVTASTGHTTLPAMIAVVVAAAIAGDTVGYQIGAHYGTRLLDIRPLQRRRARIDAARNLLARRSGPAVLLGRFVAFLRAMMPFVARVAHMRTAPSRPTMPPAAPSGALGAPIWAHGVQDRRGRRALAGYAG